MFMHNEVADPQNFPLELYVTAGSGVRSGSITVTVSAPKASHLQRLQTGTVGPGIVKKFEVNRLVKESLESFIYETPE